MLTPARLSDGNIVIVNRGFVPDARRDPLSRPQGQFANAIEIMGALRWSDDRHWFTPADDPAHNLWFTRDPAGIAAAKALDPKTVAPFYVEQDAPTPPGGGQLRPIIGRRMLKGGIARDHTKTVHPGDELSLKDVQIRTFNSHDSDAYKRGHVPVYDR